MTDPIVYEWLIHTDRKYVYIYGRTYSEGLERLSIMFNVLYGKKIYPYENCKMMNFYDYEEITKRGLNI